MKTYNVNIPTMGNFRMTFYHANSQKLSEPKEYTAHIDDCVELFVLEEGDVSFLVGGSLYPMERGDVVLSKPNEMHHCIQHTRCIHRHFCFWISAGCEFLLSDFCAHENGQGNLLCFSEKEREELLSICDQLECACEQESSEQTVFALSVGLLELCRAKLSPKTNATVLPKELSIALQVMHEEMASITTVEELCNHLFLSQSTLSRLFRKYFATSPKAYWESCRLAKSRELLRAGQSVTQVAFAVGFSDVSSFIRRFRQRFGITPFQYKNNP